MYYISCPHCGYKLMKAANGTKIELYCPKCKEKITVIVKDGVVIVGKFDATQVIAI